VILLIVLVVRVNLVFVASCFVERIRLMTPVVHALLAFVVSWFRSRLSLQLETVALRHQLAVYQSSIRRPRIRPTDRVLWSWLSRHWSAWRAALIFVRPTTIIAWQRKRFRDHWSKLSRRSKPGRPSVPQEVMHRATTASIPCAPRLPGRSIYSADCGAAAKRQGLLNGPQKPALDRCVYLSRPK
jgi:hypothetical protein